MVRRESRWGPARRNLVASFRSLTQARRAMDTLEAHGFDAAAIRLERAAGRRGRRTPATPAPPRNVDPQRPGPVTVAVGSDHPEKVEQAQEALRDLDPIELQRVDEHGEPV